VLKDEVSNNWQHYKAASGLPSKAKASECNGLKWQV
jgi:hypothetical protein